MIDARELRIGNYITDIWAEEGSMFKVKFIQRSCTYGNDFKAAYENLLPIPLTEDLLLKCGFEKEVRTDNDGDNFIVFTKNAIDIYDRTNCGGGYSYATYIKYDGSFKAGWTISTLHQLQNLFYSLCGQELTINL